MPSSCEQRVRGEGKDAGEFFLRVPRDQLYAGVAGSNSDRRVASPYCESITSVAGSKTLVDRQAHHVVFLAGLSFTSRRNPLQSSARIAHNPPPRHTHIHAPAAVDMIQ